MVFKNKRGIGIIEVMVAALVLGILYAAVSNLQKGNRETLLRIRGRDGATEVAQNIIDEISAQGLASFTDDKLIPCTDDEGTVISNCYTLAKFAADGSQVTGEDGKPIQRIYKGTLVLSEKASTVYCNLSCEATGKQFNFSFLHLKINSN